MKKITSLCLLLFFLLSCHDQFDSITIIANSASNKWKITDVVDSPFAGTVQIKYDTSTGASLHSTSSAGSVQTWPIILKNIGWYPIETPQFPAGPTENGRFIILPHIPFGNNFTIFNERHAVFMLDTFSGAAYILTKAGVNALTPNKPNFYYHDGVLGLKWTRIKEASNLQAPQASTIGRYKILMQDSSTISYNQDPQGSFPKLYHDGEHFTVNPKSYYRDPFFAKELIRFDTVTKKIDSAISDTVFNPDADPVAYTWFTRDLGNSDGNWSVTDLAFPRWPNKPADYPYTMPKMIFQIKYDSAEGTAYVLSGTDFTSWEPIQTPTLDAGPIQQGRFFVSQPFTFGRDPVDGDVYDPRRHAVFMIDTFSGSTYTLTKNGTATYAYPNFPFNNEFSLSYWTRIKDNNGDGYPQPLPRPTSIVGRYKLSAGNSTALGIDGRLGPHITRIDTISGNTDIAIPGQIINPAWYVVDFQWWHMKEQLEFCPPSCPTE